MLVLSRRDGQRILIDGGITVIVIKVQGRQVRLGIEAPKAVVVTRAELPPERAAGGSRRRPGGGIVAHPRATGGQFGTTKTRNGQCAQVFTFGR